MNKLVRSGLGLMAAFLLSIAPLTVQADAKSDVDRNIAIIFPPDLMQQMLDQTTPELLSNLKYTDAKDKSNTASAVTKFHQAFLQKFYGLVTASLKQNFTPEEIAQWASFQTTPLGTKTMSWLKTKYPGILNQSMDAPMQDLYKNLGGQ